MIERLQHVAYRLCGMAHMWPTQQQNTYKFHYDLLHERQLGINKKTEKENNTQDSRETHFADQFDQ
eukprot:3400351-Amphidinium_carterae.1